MPETEIFYNKSFITRITKTVTRIVLKLIKNRIDASLSDNQFSFRKGRGTKDAIGYMRIRG